MDPLKLGRDPVARTHGGAEDQKREGPKEEHLPPRNEASSDGMPSHECSEREVQEHGREEAGRVASEGELEVDVLERVAADEDDEERKDQMRCDPRAARNAGKRGPGNAEERDEEKTCPDRAGREGGRVDGVSLVPEESVPLFGFVKRERRGQYPNEALEPDAEDGGLTSRGRRLTDRGSAAAARTPP